MLRDSMLLRYGSSEGRTSRAPRRIGRHAADACGKVERWRCSKELALLHQPTVTGWKVSNLKNLAPPQRIAHYPAYVIIGCRGYLAMRQSCLSMRWSTPTLGARLACPSIRDRSDQARLIAATDCRKEASGAASNLGQPRNDLQVRMLNRRPGDQAMATCAGASCQTSTPSRQTQAWSEV